MPPNPSWNVPGAKGDTSNNFIVNGTTYTVRVDANVDEQKNISASELSLQDTIKTKGGTDDRVLATSYDGGKTWTPTKDAEGNPILTADQLKSLKSGGQLSTAARQAVDNLSTKNNLTNTQKNQLSQGNKANTEKNQLSQGNKANTDSKADPNDVSASAKTIAEAVQQEVVKGTRKKFTNVKYPVKLETKTQDCIKFSILEYKPRTLSLGKQFQNIRLLSVEKIKNSIGSITLPIPGSISDRNSVDWGPDNMGNLQSAFGAKAMQILTGSDAKGSDDEVKSQIDAAVGGDQKLLEAIIAVKATESAINASNIMARQYGAILNPNLELLFNSPSLRDFTFQFRMTPRDPDEAKVVKTIISYFKQAMAPQRSSSVILLKTPYVFGIQYLTNDTDHPYLNKFKECALTQCSVNYTPDNTYSVYEGEPSMTAYEMTLTFQELEPIFNDDYGDSDPVSSVGY